MGSWTLCPSCLLAAGDGRSSFSVRQRDHCAGSSGVRRNLQKKCHSECLSWDDVQRFLCFTIHVWLLYLVASLMGCFVPVRWGVGSPGADSIKLLGWCGRLRQRQWQEHCKVGTGPMDHESFPQIQMYCRNCDQPNSRYAMVYRDV